MVGPDLEDDLRSELDLLARRIDGTGEADLLGRVSQAITRRERRHRALVAGSVLVAVALIGGAAVVLRPSPGIQIDPVAPSSDASSGPDAPVRDEATRLQLSPTGPDYLTDSPEFESGVFTSFTEVVPGDDGQEPQLGGPGDMPSSTRLQFLWDVCRLRLGADEEVADCFRDPSFVNDDGLGSGPWVADRPFYIAHGFPATGLDPLAAGFDVAVYITRSPEDLDDADTAFELDQTVRFRTDRIVREQAVRCGPTYRQQTQPGECVLFVHDFPDGLPTGRYEIAVVWEAPCHAWVDYGLADRCDDPDRIEGRFSSLVDSPWSGGSGVAFDHHNHVGLTADEILELDGIDADEYRATTATLDGLVESFNAGQLDDYLAAFAPDVAGPNASDVHGQSGVPSDTSFDLIDADVVAALMAASARWEQGCGSGDGFGTEGVISCTVEIVDRFHLDALPVRGDLTFAFDEEGRIASIRPDATGQSIQPFFGNSLRARRAYGLAFKEWLVETHPDVAAPMQGRWLANGMPHPDDMAVALRYVTEYANR